MTSETALEIARSVRSGDRSAVDVVTEALARIEAGDRDVAAFLRTTPARSLEAARRIDSLVSGGGDPGPLAGVPVAVKDVLCTEGVETTCGSKILAGWEPPYTATAVTRLEAAGAVVVGKTNMDEFAMGSSTENSAFGPTRNPHDLERVPGGSSGGSAAAVAAGFVPVALGSDTGGSIRQPASLCGIVGMKPTYGRVSRYGLVAFASSLDQIGPMTLDVADAAAVYTAIAGHDPLDATSIPDVSPDVKGDLHDDVEGLTFGVIRELSEGDAFDPAVLEAFRRTLAAIEGAGGRVVEVSLPSAEHALSAYYLIAPAEASSNLARFDGMRYGLRIECDSAEETNRRTREAGFGDEVKRRIMLGTYALSAGYYDAYYAKAQRVRTLVIRDFVDAYSEADVLCSPTSPTVAFGLGERLDNPLAMYQSDLCTIPTNLAGHPAISVWCGDDASGLPIGFQVLAPELEEARLFRAAAGVEALVGFKEPACPGVLPGEGA